MERIHNKRLDLSEASKDHRKFKMKQGDSFSTKFDFEVQQKGVDISLDSYNILVNFKLPNKNIVKLSSVSHPDLVVVNDSSLSIIVPPEVSLYSGEVVMEVSFFEDNFYLTSKSLSIFVYESIDLDLEEEEITSIPLLIDLLNLAGDKINEFDVNVTGKLSKFDSDSTQVLSQFETQSSDMLSDFDTDSTDALNQFGSSSNQAITTFNSSGASAISQVEANASDALGSFANDSADAIEGFINESKDVESKYPQRLSNLEGRVGYLEMGDSVKRYGVRRKLGATSAELERLGDAVGLVANADTSLSSYNKVVNDFDDIYPWSHMRRCKITETGRIIYDSYPNYDQTEGDWMIEIPEFYIKHTNDGEYLEYWVSEFGGKDYDFVDKFYIAQFKTTPGHRSLPYEAPLVIQSRSQFRTGARNKGSGWQIVDLMSNYALRVLYQVEFAHLNSQNELGAGVTGVRYVETDELLLAETNTNRVVISDASAAYYEVGETVEVGTARGSRAGAAMRLITAINSIESGQTEMILDGEPFETKLNYIVYSAGQHTGKTLDLTSSSGQSVGRSGRQSISYRGVEDIFGNVYEWTDGALIDDHQAYVTDDPSKYSDTITDDYITLGYSNATVNGYPIDMGYDEGFKFAEFPVNLGAGSSTGYCDNYYQNTGLRAPIFGGAFSSGANAGLFLWYLNNAPSYATVNVGSRLLYRPE